MTGRYPFRYGLHVGVVRPWASYGLSLNERLLPQDLKEVGYETAITGKWHLGHLSREYFPTSRGFDHQYGHYNGALDYFTHQRDGGHDWHRNDQPNYDEGYSTELIGQEAIQRIKHRDKNKPLFLYVPFNAVHTPLQVPEKYKAIYTSLSGNRQLYAAMVTAMDEQIGKIYQALKEEGLLESTLIMFSSDNGGERPGRVSSNLPYRSGKGTVYEGGVRVSALAYWKGVIPAGTVVTAPIHISDLNPTFLRLAHGKTTQREAIDGQDVWPLLVGKEKERNRLIPLNVAPNGGAVIEGDWKLVVAKGNPLKIELFNLATDVAEKKDLSEAQPEKAKDLLAKYESFEKESVAPKSSPKPANFKSLKIWGYPELGTIP